MIQAEIINDNALIAEFMGKEVKHISGHGQYIWVYKKRVFKKDAVLPLNVLTIPKEELDELTEDSWINIEHPFDGLNYNCSWELLMPVVVKINKTLGKFKGLCSVQIGIIDSPYNTCTISAPMKKFQVMDKTLIDCVWLCVVEFIKWHNEKIKA